MVFSSMVFLWIFFPIVFVLGMIIREPKYQNLILLAASLIFYAWGEPKYIFLLLLSIFLNWAFGIAIDRKKEHAKLFLTLDVICNLGLLGWFKYAGLFADTLRKVIPGIPVLNIALPIGISFFTFQAMSYVIDLYRGRCKVQNNFLHLALYVSFFPQLIAGPIVMYRDIDRQITDRKITTEGVASGFRRFIYGLGKKVIISNMLAVAVDRLFALSLNDMTSAMAWTAAILYTLQIYYDFSGYSDMAIGLGRIFGFEFLENFNLPYISASIKEFWRRWHISLSTWFRDYLYIPLGGNRKGKYRTYLNLFIVFAMTGFWHGASWNFLFWGLFHGVFLIIERMGFGKILERSKVLSRVYTMLVVMIGWVFFYETDFHKACAMVKRMVLPFAYMHSGIPLGTLVGRQTLIAAVLGILGCGILQCIFRTEKGQKIAKLYRGSFAEALFCTVILLYSLLLLANNTYNPFIYYRF